MSKLSQRVTDKLAFHGKKSLFVGWKDKIKVHLIARSDALVVFQAGRKEPIARYEHALLMGISVPEEGVDVSDGEKSAFALFEKIANSDFKSVVRLFQQLKAARDQANQNGCEALTTGLISQHLMLIKVLTAKRRGEISTRGGWVADVDAAPSKPGVTGKPSGTAKLSGSVLGKRKVPSVPGQDLHYNLGAMRCHYCAGVHNNMNDIGPPMKFQWPKHEGYRQEKSQGGQKGDTHRRLSAIEGAMQGRADDSVTTSNGGTGATTSPTVFVTSPPGTLEPKDTNEPMEQFDVPVNAGSVITSQPLGPEAIAETARGIESMVVKLEDTVRSVYPFLLNLDDA
ncbi:unnamed protein product [Phytophthora fragariaefolia]|uniref:Unnamed protein product n=1 Tax=Phytophthora fragariaefolia TaxID=1490495 RepID=A0A9W6XDL2_9STRA|nr:unnamed protein product [Phytophthora fragariaefolia]